MTSATAGKPSISTRHTPSIGDVADEAPCRFVDVPGPLDCEKPAVANIAVRAHRMTSLNLMVDSFVYSYPCCFAMAAVANDPPSPMVSTAEEGTITMEPLSLIAS